MIKKLHSKDSRAPARVVPFPTAQELFDRWKAVPTQENRRMLGLAIEREDVEIRRSQIISWALQNLDPSPLGDRRAEMIAQTPGCREAVEGDDPRDLVIAALKDALRDVARNYYGMQAIIEEHGDDENAFNLHAHEYYRQQNSFLQMTAHGALADLEALLAEKPKGNSE